jgi:hypothetical protein
MVLLYSYAIDLQRTFSAKPAVLAFARPPVLYSYMFDATLPRNIADPIMQQ